MRPRSIARIISALVVGIAICCLGGCKPHRTAERLILRPAFKITKKTLRGALRTTTKLLTSKRAKRVAVSVVKKAVKGEMLSFDPNVAAAALAEALIGESAAEGIELILVDPKEIVEGKLKDTVTHYLIIEPLESFKRKHDGREEEVARCRATLKDAETGDVVEEQDIEIISTNGRDWTETQDE